MQMTSREKTNGCLGSAVAVDKQEVKGNVIYRDEEGSPAAGHTDVEKYKLWVANELAWKYPIRPIRPSRVVLRHAEADCEDAKDNNEGDHAAIVPSPNSSSESECHREGNIEACCENGAEPVEPSQPL